MNALMQAKALVMLERGYVPFNHPKGYLQGETHWVVRHPQRCYYGDTPIEALAAAYDALYPGEVPNVVVVAREVAERAASTLAMFADDDVDQVSYIAPEFKQQLREMASALAGS